MILHKDDSEFIHKHKGKDHFTFSRELQVQDTNQRKGIGTIFINILLNMAKKLEMNKVSLSRY